MFFVVVKIEKLFAPSPPGGGSHGLTQKTFLLGILAIFDSKMVQNEDYGCRKIINTASLTEFFKLKQMENCNGGVIYGY